MSISKKVEKTRCNGQWTESRYITFIKGILRGATWKWAPISDVFKAARVERGKYLCAGYEREPHVVPVTVDKKKAVYVDHISPIVGDEGFTTWDDFINNLFCDSSNLQVLCKNCHDLKSKAERTTRNNKKKEESIE